MFHYTDTHWFYISEPTFQSEDGTSRVGFAWYAEHTRDLPNREIIEISSDHEPEIIEISSDEDVPDFTLKWSEEIETPWSPNQSDTEYSDHPEIYKKK